MRQSRILRTCIIALILAAIITRTETVASGLEVKGRLRSELYTWSDEKGDHLRPYQYLRADAILWKGERLQKLSLHTYLRWTTDLKDKLSRDPQTFIYETYIKRSKAFKDVDVYAGRQFVYTSLGSETIDGFRVRSKIRSKFRLDLFAGSSVSRLDPERIQSFSDYGVLGGRLAYLVNSRTRAGLNWMRLRSEGATSYHRLGFDLRKSANRWQAYGRLSYNVSDG